MDEILRPKMTNPEYELARNRLLPKAETMSRNIIKSQETLRGSKLLKNEKVRIFFRCMTQLAEETKLTAPGNLALFDFHAKKYEQSDKEEQK